MVNLVVSTYFIFRVAAGLSISPSVLFLSLNRETEHPLWQVDVDMFEALFTSLAKYLELENAYNVFVLNPKHDKKIAKYGYR